MLSALILLADIDECSEGISGCSQLCSNTIGTYSCNCQNGYQLGSDNHTCVGKIFNALIMIGIAYDGTDINECTSQNGGCEQICTNSNGSFQCSCYSGFSGNIFCSG